jgi:hypothetical protein
VPIDLNHPALSLQIRLPDTVPAGLDELWAGWQTGTGLHARPLDIRLGGAGPMAPDGATPIGYGRLRGWAGDDRLVMSSPQGSLVVDYAAAAGLLILPDMAPDLAFSRDTLWRLTTLELARTQGSYYLHGAAWRGPHGIDIVCAEGGTGKSTLAAAMLTAGHRVITDDGALFRPGAVPAITALPAAWRLSGPAAVWHGLPDDGVKHRFWPEPAQRASEGPPGRLFFAERSDQLRMLPLTPAEALPRLIRQNPLLMTSRRLAAPHLEALRELAETVPSYRLLLGPELLDNPQAAVNLLAM